MKIVCGGTDKFNNGQFFGTEVFCSLELDSSDIGKSQVVLASELKSIVSFQQYQRFVSSMMDAYARGTVEFLDVVARIKEYRTRQEKFSVALESKTFLELIDKNLDKIKHMAEGTNGEQH